MGIKILSEQEFMELINSSAQSKSEESQQNTIIEEEQSATLPDKQTFSESVVQGSLF